MTVDCTFPRVQHIAVVILFSLNAALVIEFSQLSCAFLIHNLLEITTHCSVPFANLSQNVSLVFVAIIFEHIGHKYASFSLRPQTTELKQQCLKQFKRRSSSTLVLNVENNKSIVCKLRDYAST